MVPSDHIQFPFRWLFVPVRDPRDGSVRWKWSAQTQTGEPAMESSGDFESLTECMADARLAGYGGK